MKYSRNVQNMNLTKKLALGVAALMAFAASSASAATYLASRAVGNGFLEMSITTTDIEGVLTDSDILDWEFTLTQGDDHVTLVPVSRLEETPTPPSHFRSSTFLLLGTGLRAAGGHLYFNFAETDAFFKIGGPSVETNETFWYVYGHPTDPTERGETLLAGLDFGNRTLRPLASEEILASLDGSIAIPEPATWALMITGFGLAGGMLRVRRRLDRELAQA